MFVLIAHAYKKERINTSMNFHGMSAGRLQFKNIKFVVSIISIFKV